MPSLYLAPVSRGKRPMPEAASSTPDTPQDLAFPVNGLCCFDAVKVFPMTFAHESSAMAETVA